MSFFTNTGRILFAIAMGCFGAHYLAFVTRISSQPPGPPWFPNQIWMSGAACVCLLSAGIFLAANWKAGWTAFALGIALFLRVAAIHLPRVLVNLHDPGPWTSAGEILSICGAALVLAGTITSPSGNPVFTDVATRIGQYLFALPLFIFGAQHLLYGRFVATLIPAWIPGHLFWAYFIGAAFIAAGLAILVQRVAGLASSLLGLMFFLWVAILHSPRVVHAPLSGNEWTSTFVALAMSGGAMAVAGSFTDSD